MLSRCNKIYGQLAERLKLLLIYEDPLYCVAPPFSNVVYPPSHQTSVCTALFIALFL